MDHDKFNICCCCGRIIGYAGSELSNIFCSIKCEMSERESDESRLENYSKSYDEFKKKLQEYFK